MNINGLEYIKLNNLFYKWISDNDLDKYALLDPMRAAAFGFYAARYLGNLVDEWDVRLFVELVNKDTRDESV